ncbi:MAG TPA: hypothetical protein VKU00_11375 [Chthonomonadaceae bacterium]|nr:hypothetical protein [Chthonomonadaceae bacterium]
MRDEIPVCGTCGYKFALQTTSRNVAAAPQEDVAPLNDYWAAVYGAPVESPQPASASPYASEVIKRYEEAYQTAKTTCHVGDISRKIGIGLAVILALGSLAGVIQQNWILLWSLLLLAGAVGALFYILGVLASAQGSALKASLDGAVNTSPFLTKEQKAKVLLPLEENVSPTNAPTRSERPHP